MVLISNNLDTVTRVDQILVLDYGRLVEQRTYRELAVAGGVFQALATGRNEGR